MQGSSSKIVRQNGLKSFLKNWKFLSPTFGLYWGNFWPWIRQFFWKTRFGTSFIIWSFWRFSTFGGKIWAIFRFMSENIPLKAYWMMSSVYVERLPTFWLQNYSKSTQIPKKRSRWKFSTELWSHSEVFLKPNPGAFTLQKVMLFYIVLLFLIVLEFITESLGICTEIASKTTKTCQQKVLFNNSGSIRGSFLVQFNLSRDERRFNILVYEVYRYFDKNEQNSENQKTFEIFFFRCHFRTVFVYKTAFMFPLSILDITFFCWLFSTFQSIKSVENLEKSEKKCSKIGELSGFLSFSVSFWDIFIQKFEFFS